MSRALIIGAGGVAGVVIAKCCRNSEVFSEIMIASRTKEKCDAIRDKLQPTTKTVISTARVDADNVGEWIKAGCVAVGAGGSLTKGAGTGNYGLITETAQKFCENIRKARGEAQENRRRENGKECPCD